jgi:hypothetical protein
MSRRRESLIVVSESVAIRATLASKFQFFLEGSS